MKGLNEALEVSKEETTTVKRRKVTVSPVPEYNASKIKKIRESLNLSQMIFAEAMKKTLIILRFGLFIASRLIPLKRSRGKRRA